MTIQEYFGPWQQVINLQEADSLIQRLCMLAHRDNLIICPQIKDIFKAFHLCPLSSLRVVIIGQDPYPTLSGCGTTTSIPVATGIAFANRPSTPSSSFSPSLSVLSDSVIDFTVPHGIINFDPSLEKWEEQGVLLLNSALSCIAGQPGSHSLLWRPFISSLLTSLSRHTVGIVYVLMGSQAQSFRHCINEQSNHVLCTKHPAWYARNHSRMPSSIWHDINSILIGLNGYGIQWYSEQ